MTAEETVSAKGGSASGGKKVRKPARAQRAGGPRASPKGGSALGGKKASDASATPAATPRAKPVRQHGRGPAKVAGPSRLRIKVRAYEHGVLDGAVKQIIDVAARHNAHVIGPVPLPIDIKKYTVNRAAFIDKDSREQFEMRIHKRMIDILNPAPKVIEALTNIDLPSGVTIDVKML